MVDRLSSTAHQLSSSCFRRGRLLSDRRTLSMVPDLKSVGAKVLASGVSQRKKRQACPIMEANLEGNSDAAAGLGVEKMLVSLSLACVRTEVALRWGSS